MCKIYKWSSLNQNKLCGLFSWVPNSAPLETPLAEPGLIWKIQEVFG